MAALPPLEIGLKMNSITQDDWLRRAEEGLRADGIADDLISAVLERLQVWLAMPAVSDQQPYIHAIIERGDWSLLVDSFYQEIPFGTAGRRGAVGYGPNRINRYTISTWVEGHADFLHQRFPDCDISVVIAWDVREFFDFRGRYDLQPDDPLFRLTSRALAMTAVEVYAGNGIRSHVIQEDAPLLSTPEVSWLIRRLGAQGGINVSASHIWHV